MALVHPYVYKKKITQKQDKLISNIPLDKPRIWIDFNEFVDSDDEGVSVYLFSQCDVVNDSNGSDVEVFEGMKVSVFDVDLDENGNPDALLADGMIVKNYLSDYPKVKWFIKLNNCKGKYRSNNSNVYWMSDLM